MVIFRTLRILRIICFHLSREVGVKGWVLFNKQNMFRMYIQARSVVMCTCPCYACNEPFVPILHYWFGPLQLLPIHVCSGSAVALHVAILLVPMSEPNSHTGRHATRVVPQWPRNASLMRLKRQYLNSVSRFWILHLRSNSGAVRCCSHWKLCPFPHCFETVSVLINTAVHKPQIKLYSDPHDSRIIHLHMTRYVLFLLFTPCSLQIIAQNSHTVGHINQISTFGISTRWQSISTWTMWMLYLAKHMFP